MKYNWYSRAGTPRLRIGTRPAFACKETEEFGSLMQRGASVLGRKIPVVQSRAVFWRPRGRKIPVVQSRAEESAGARGGLGDKTPGGGELEWAIAVIWVRLAFASVCTTGVFCPRGRQNTARLCTTGIFCPALFKSGGDTAP